MKPQKLSLGQIIGQAVGINVPCKVPEATDRDVLRALVKETDILGTDARGDMWLLVRTTPELVEWLATMDAADEDAEEDDPGEENGDDEDNGDRESDIADFEPDDRDTASHAQSLSGSRDARWRAECAPSGGAHTPKPALWRLPRALRKQLKAAMAKRRAKP